jgi:CRP-like cAMP-binding protein
VAPLLVDWLGARGALVVAGALLPVLVVPAWPRLTAIDRAARVPEEQLELLRGNAIFAPLPASTLEQLADRMAEVRAQAGEQIVRQGEPGDLFYVIEEGTVEVAVDGQPAHELGRGESFGEIALLRNVPRTATVTARTDVLLYALDRSTFIPAVTGSGPSLSAAEGVIGMRLAPGRVAAARR